nr:hypothetical protein [Candidatus Obscuribacter sp.]
MEEDNYRAQNEPSGGYAGTEDQRVAAIRAVHVHRVVAVAEGELDRVGAGLAEYTQPERLKWPRGFEGAPAAEAETGRPGATLMLRV